MKSIVIDNIENLPRVSARDYLRGSDKVKKWEMTGTTFAVTNRNNITKIITPIKDTRKKYTAKDVFNIRFKGPKNLSKNIDKIVYG